jgi:hypothetical protein
MKRKLLPYLLGIIASSGVALAQSPYKSSEDFARYAMKLRESALLRLEPQVLVPTTRSSIISNRYPWRTNIVTTTFWWLKTPSQNILCTTAAAWDRIGPSTSAASTTRYFGRIANGAITGRPISSEPVFTSLFPK